MAILLPWLVPLYSKSTKKHNKIPLISRPHVSIMSEGSRHRRTARAIAPSRWISTSHSTLARVYPQTSMFRGKILIIRGNLGVPYFQKPVLSRWVPSKVLIDVCPCACGGFLQWRIPKSPWGSILNLLKTWMISGYPDFRKPPLK